jgi:hypothetical protein
MPDRNPHELPQNSLPLNQAALHWLREAQAAPLEPHRLYLLSLAFWGLENGAEGEWPERDGPAVEQQVGLLLAWKPANVLAWLTSNPNGPDRAEQASNLLSLLENAENPRQAAAWLLSEIYSRQVADNPALQPAASELS